MKYVELGEGIVLEKKKITDKSMLRVIPRALVSNKTGEYKFEEEEKDAEPTMTQNAEGLYEQFVIKEADWVWAEWFGDGGNRATAPDMKRGMTVRLFKLLGTDEIKWSHSRREHDIPGKEAVLHTFSNTDEHGVETTKKNTWKQLISTETKEAILIETTDNDGEAGAYFIGALPKDGKININDNKGNGIYLKTKNGEWTVQANKTVNVTAPTVNINGGSVVNVKGGVLNFSGSKANFDLPVDFNQSVNFNSSVKLKGSTDVSGSIIFNSNGETVTGIKLK